MKQSNDSIKLRDFSLIKKTLKGDNNAFATLMSYYKSRVFYFGKSFFHNNEDSEDFVQDVFIKVFTNLHTFKGKSSFLTWLMKIAYSIAINSINRRKEYLPLNEEFPLFDNGLSPEEMQIRKVTKEAIRQAMKELPEKYVICIELYFSFDVPYKEISDITDIPVGTVKSNIYRAKQILKDKLEALYEKQN